MLSSKDLRGTNGRNKPPRPSNSKGNSGFEY